MRLSNKFRQSLSLYITGKKNKAFMLKFSAKAFVMSRIFSKFELPLNH